MSKISHILQQRCKAHPAFPCELLLLSGESQGTRACMLCVQKKNISMDDVLYVRELLDQSADLVLSTYPPLNDAKLSQQMFDLSDQEGTISAHIDEFFDALKAKIDVSIEKARTKAKTEATRIEFLRTTTLSTYKKIAQLDDLKEIIMNPNMSDSDSQQNLTQIIQNQRSKAQENSNTFRRLLDEYNKGNSTYSVDQAYQIEAQVTRTLEHITFFNSGLRSLLPQLSFHGSKQLKDSPKELSVKRNEHTHAIEVTFTGNHDGSYRQGYLNLDIEAHDKYIVRVELIQNSGREIPDLLVGLIPDHEKDSIPIYSYGLCYLEADPEYGICTLLQGNQLHSGLSATHLKKIIEVQICVQERILRVRDFPHYSSLVDLSESNKKKLDPTGRYRFGIGMSYPNDSIRILEVLKVDHFGQL